jgi:hypothetical protein
VEDHSCVIVGVQATAARLSQETVAVQDMIARFAEWQGRNPVSVAADATYGEFLQWLMERETTPDMRTWDSALVEIARYRRQSGYGVIAAKYCSFLVTDCGRRRRRTQ